jgi:Fe-S oxidoreductase
LIEGFKGVKLIELEQSGKRAGCCGGGGGKVWLNIRKEERLADRIIREAFSKDVDAVVTACPYCLIMLEYSRDLLANETQRALEVLDLSELVQRSS